MTDQEIVQTCDGCGVERIGPGIGDVPGQKLLCANDRCGSESVTISATFDNDSGLHDEFRSKLRDTSKNSREGRILRPGDDPDLRAGCAFLRRGDGPFRPRMACVISPGSDYCPREGPSVGYGFRRSTGWPVRSAMSSKSLSRWSTV
jgi:hypothetical protein